MTKTTINGNTTFHPECKCHTKPEILESYIGDDGEKWLILSNGRETLETRYIAMWQPIKGKVKGEFYKGENPDRKNISNLFSH